MDKLLLTPEEKTPPILSEKKIAKLLTERHGYPITIWSEREALKLQRDADTKWYEAQLAKAKRELCGHCDTPLLREGELYQKLAEAEKQERERIIEYIEEFELFTNYSGDFRATLISELKRQALKEGE